MKHDQADRERAIQHVVAFEKLVTEQRERVVRLKANGSDAETAEYLLAALGRRGCASGFVYGV